MNGHSENSTVAEYREQLQVHPEFAPIVESLNNEYKLMVDILSNNGQDKLIDCGKEAFPNK